MSSTAPESGFGDESRDFKLRPDLAEYSLARFDELRARGKLFYEESTPEYVEDEGFRFEFRISSVLLKKPILKPDDPGRKQAMGPFANPEPEFVLTSVGPSHTLQLSKYTMHRPAFILHTNEFALQTSDLDASDFSAAWSVLNAFAVPQVLAYNCGVEAGASQGHKHLQVFPRPEPLDFQMFPDKMELSQDVPSSSPDIPFMHWVMGIPKDANASDVYIRYLKLLEKLLETSREIIGAHDYNILFVKEWIIVVPRMAKSRDRVGANAAGMLGLVWLRDQQERDGWTKFGMSKHLAHLGVPIKN